MNTASDKLTDTITRCPKCRKLVGAYWCKGPWPGLKSPLPGWRIYQHADAYGEPYCEGGGQKP
jgi:hypothetical protein